MITKIPFNNGKYDWININIENPTELKKFYEEYEIDDEVVAYSLDRNERAHLEYDLATNTFVLFFNVPNNEKIDDHYETIPMTFLIKGSQFITVTNAKNQYVADKMKRYLDNNDGKTIFEFLFSSLFMITDSYFPFVEQMDADRKTINDKLKEKTTKQNLVLLEQIKTHIIYRTLDANEKEQFEDAVIEAKQLVEMTQLSSQILQQLSGTYNNILNNNLNDTIKILTVLSILLTIPTIITGFFGMNMPLPLEHNPFGWITTIAISVVVWFVLSYVLRRLLRR